MELNGLFCVVALAVVLLNLVEVQSQFVGSDAAGVPFNVSNANFEFQTAQYAFSNLQVSRASISGGCVVTVTPSLMNQAIFVDWPSAHAAGCTYFITILQQYASSSVAIPSVIVFSSNSPNLPGLLEPYQDRSFLSGNQPNFNPPGLFSAIVSVADGALLNSLAFPLMANISSNPSLVTLEMDSAGFKAMVWTLVTSFCIIAVYCSFEILALWIQQRSLVFNIRVFIYFGFLGLSLCRIVSEGVDYWSFKGWMPFVVTDLLWWLGIWALYIALCSLLLGWSSMAIRELGFSSRRWVARSPRIFIIITIVLLSLVIVFRIVYYYYSTFAIVYYLLYVLLAPMLALMLGCCVFFGTRILLSLSVSAASLQTKAVVRTITVLMLGVVVSLLAQIIVIVLADVVIFSNGSYGNPKSLLQKLETYIMLDSIMIFTACFTFYALALNNFGSTTRASHQGSRASPSPAISDRSPVYKTSDSPSQLLEQYATEIEM